MTAIDERKHLTCGLTREPSVYDPDGKWPITFTGWVKGVEDAYDLDDVIESRTPDELNGRVMVDSESSQIFLYAADTEAADWIEQACEKISAHLTRQVPPPTLAERLADVEL